jgi:hypothetical protein
LILGLALRETLGDTGVSQRSSSCAFIQNSLLK